MAENEPLVWRPDAPNEPVTSWMALPAQVQVTVPPTPTVALRGEKKLSLTVTEADRGPEGAVGVGVGGGVVGVGGGVVGADAVGVGGTGVAVDAGVVALAAGVAAEGDADAPGEGDAEATGCGLAAGERPAVGEADREATAVVATGDTVAAPPSSPPQADRNDVASRATGIRRNRRCTY